jgi:transcriptional regulator GlxA family with amidase domain
MKHVSILVPQEAVLAAVDDPRHVFTEVNNFLASQGQPPVFDIQLVGQSRQVPLHGGRFTVHTDALLDEVERTDLIFVPALKGDQARCIELNRDLAPWVVRQYEAGAEVASLCVGAFLLASTGLLRGRQCSTNWVLANEFRAMFPDVKLVTEKIITEDEGIYTSGGAHSYWNLLLYLVEKHASRDLAILCAKVFQVEMDRASQSPFMVFRGQRLHTDEPVKRVQEFIEIHYADGLTVDALADRFALGRRNLERRFKKATDNTVIEYIQRVKIEAAKKAFESTWKTIYEIMDEVGYADVKAFREVFKRLTGLSPTEYRNRYNRAAVNDADLARVAREERGQLRA